MDSAAAEPFDLRVPRIVLRADSVLTRAFPAWQAGIRALARDPATLLVFPPHLGDESRARIEKLITGASGSLAEREVPWTSATSDARAANAALISFVPWTESEAARFLARWPGRKLCAVDWLDSEAPTQLQRLQDARADHVLSEFLPDEVSALPASLREFFVAHWAWLPPCVRLPDADQHRGRSDAVLYLATSERDFDLTAPTSPLPYKPAWRELVPSLRAVEGLSPVELETLDFSKDATQSALGARAWVIGSASPQCAMALPVVARAAGAQAHVLAVASVSPFRWFVTREVSIPRTTEKLVRPSLRALIEPGLVLLNRAAPSVDAESRSGAARLLQNWTCDAFVDRVRSLSQARDASPFAGLSWPDRVSQTDRHCPVAAALVTREEFPQARTLFASDFERDAMLADWMPAYVHCLAHLHAWSDARIVAERYFARATEPTPVVSWNVEQQMPLSVSFDSPPPPLPTDEREPLLAVLELEATNLPTSARTWITLGEVHERAGQIGAAADAFARAIEIDINPYRGAQTPSMFHTQLLAWTRSSDV